MKKYFFLVTISIMLILYGCGEPSEPTQPTIEEPTCIDTCYSFIWGSSQNYGRDSVYFPQNIFGEPSRTANQKAPAVGENELCSIGFGGEIVVGCKGRYIVDGDGVDFVVFENVMKTGDRIFAEPAVISVSRDGVNFVEFPFDPITLQGLAGINWTNGSVDWKDYPACGGDGFDLATINMDSITHIKIKDTTHIISTLPTTSPYYSPPALLSGFDLDAVVLRYTIKK